MFKKLKDKISEEVKSSPQRIQQFAQAAQAAVTSASSSISDITNSDLFSIGDNESQQNKPQVTNQNDTFQNVSLTQPSSAETAIPFDYASGQNIIENQRQRRLSNSSFASDISFRLPSYESPSMYHLQSDMEISASEAEERGFSGGTVSLDRVTKEQLYTAYRRTQERYVKYRTQYADLARHYKLLERENAKAKSVLVETQDKALRRISELREQCSLEQSAKAHLEKALRVEIEERNMKIDTLNTKIQLLQGTAEANDGDHKLQDVQKESNIGRDTQLIDLLGDSEENAASKEVASEIITLNKKVEKLEQLVNKYKESLKLSKEKNSQIITELQMYSKDLENKNKQIEELKTTALYITEAKQKIQDLEDLNEELQNKINAYDFNKTKETSTLEVDLQKSLEEISQLRAKIEVCTKREEEYAISLAENKLCIHKELESKEAEIKSLKESLSSTNKEIQSLTIVINEYKNTISTLENECSKLNNNANELSVAKTRITELTSQVKELTAKCQSLEQLKLKADEECKCLQLQIKQETAEKLAMIDRNSYLENRNSQLIEENGKKNAYITNLENEMQIIKQQGLTKEKSSEEELAKEKQFIEEINLWKSNYNNLEAEIQGEREELIKLQSEIEKLLLNHELMQKENSDLHVFISELKEENSLLNVKIRGVGKLKDKITAILSILKDLREKHQITIKELNSLKEIHNDYAFKIMKNINILSNISLNEDTYKNRYEKLEVKMNEIQLENAKSQINMEVLQAENVDFKKKIETYIKETNLLNETISNMNEQIESNLKECKSLREENKNLELTLNNSERNREDLESIAKLNEEKYSNELISLKNDRDKLIEKIAYLENMNSLLNTEKEEIVKRHDDLTNKLHAITEEQDELIAKAKILENKEIQIAELERNIATFSQENTFLKSEAEQITKNVKELESEINDVRNSHAEIEDENVRLNAILVKLENIESKSNFEDKEVQTKTNEIQNEHTPDLKEKCFDLQNVSALQAKNNETGEEIKALKQYNEDLKNQTLNKEEELHKISLDHNVLKNNYDTLQEENRRLQSDIEGLKTYLTKVSKENSLLNDKIRDLIVSSDGHADISPDNLNDSEFGNQNSKGSIDELVRENTLLIEENLELKDQLRSQNDKSTNINKTNHEYATLKQDYNNLMNTKNELEKRIANLEYSDRNVDMNMQHIQENNNKLRQNNEKLERRLDEALVSLRHLHSLTENTELEYLRNILYEYLTGSGTHSITLAKVLSAVVKFDEKQTKTVLQKEKERQGLLHQFGLL